MKSPTAFLSPACWLLPLLVAAGCATRPAPDIHGRWKPVNRYSTQTQEIPLSQDYVFYPAPMDGTLKTMLERWARDRKMTLSYLHPSDFTLHAPVAQIRTANLQDAVSQLSTIYAGQRLAITVDQSLIIVRRASATDPIAPAAAP